MMELERKFTTAPEVLTLGDGAALSGHASLFGLPDQGGDIVVPGAYAASLARLEAAGRRVKMLWQHDPAQPIGLWDEVREDDRGLFVRGRLLTDLPTAREAATLVAAGAVDGLSIGYRTIRAERGPDGTRRLLEIDLWEVSLVTFPMLAEARVAAKAEAPGRAATEALTALFTAARRDLARGRAPLTRAKD